MYGSRRCLELSIGGYRASVPCADITLNIALRVYAKDARDETSFVADVLQRAATARIGG